MTAVNSATGNQVTTYGYGTSLPSSDIARTDILTSVTYPDGGIVTYLANRQGQTKQFTDQRLVIHAYDFDLLGRQTQDHVISLGPSSSSSSSSSGASGSSGTPLTENYVDGTVQRIGRTHEVRGMLENVTSYSSPIVGQGTVVNDVQRVYNSFGQLITEYQEHSGAVNTSTSVNVQYQYADGSSNTIRPTALVYPNGRVLTYSYGTAGAIDDALSRIASLIDSDGVTHLADYTRIGAETFVQQSSPQPQIAWSLINGSGIDPYTGLDQFNRVVDNRWYSTATNSDLDRIQHGYDQANNRLWRKNTVAEAAGVYLDELYSYDGIYRLKEMQRGQLNGLNNGIVSGTLSFAQAWGVDATGNWMHFWQNSTGSAWDFQQTRTANNANQIGSIVGGGWAQPIYDATGNMVQMPDGGTPPTADQASYDAWNRTISVSGGESPLQRNIYDGLYRRVTKVTDGTMRHCYYTSNWRDVEERLGVNAPPDRQFVWGRRYLDDVLLRDRGSERLYGVQDANWNVTAISTANGTAAERYAYSAYGYPVFATGSFLLLGSSAFEWETLLGGYRWDTQPHRYSARRRDFNPRLGCWGSRDSLALGEPSPNLYALLSNNPLRFVDPRGLAVVDAVCTQHWVAVCGEAYTSGTEKITVPVALPPATASTACPKGWICKGWRSLAGDEARLAKICGTLKCPGCTVTDCEQSVAKLISAARRTRVFPVWYGRCQAWVSAFESRLPEFFGPCFTNWGMQRFSLPSWPSTGHAAYYITFCDGTTVYFDISTWGGGDHIFFEGDIPPYATPE